MSAPASGPARPVEFALVSEVVPPSWSGQAVLIRRLLTGLDPGAFCLLTSDQGIYGGGHIQPLETRCYRLPAARTRYLTGNRWLLVGSALAGVGAAIAHRAFHIARVARRERCRAIVAFTGDFHDLPAASIAGRLLDLPLYVYMCDYYSHRELYAPARRRLSPLIERMVVRGAARVICGADTLADALAERYDIEPAVIHHPVDLSLYDLTSPARPVAGSQPARIVYTGTLYEAQLDAAQNLLAALDRLDRRGAVLHVYGGQSAEELRERGLTGKLVVHPHAAGREIAAIQEAADVLFLPLAFRSQYPEVVRTSAPMKFGEYLAAGGPILVHAPADAFVAEYCRRHDCAVVVEDPDPRSLVPAVEALIADDALRARLIRNARQRAASDFSIDVARARFCALLNLADPHRA
ncbi:MAG: glycosyltransferase [Actinomycetota bacterium]|nr:glycosyltransferase [Actinomycetota bacterium]